MSFPSSPTNGQLAVINNITYVYSSTTNSWTRQQHTFNNTGPVPPTTNLLVGDIWYNTNDDTVYRYTYDGTSYYWVDIITPTVTTSTTNLNFGTITSNTFTSNTVNTTAVYANSYYFANGSVLTTGSSVPKITSVQVTNASYVANGWQAVSNTGGYIIINGTGFVSGANVVIGTKTVTGTYVSSTLMQVPVPAQTNGYYTVYVVNPDGGVAINVPGLIYNDVPIFTTGATLPGAVNGSSVSIQLFATDSQSLTYSLASGSLPPGLTLSSSGLISGIITGVTSATVYNFAVTVTDIYSQVAQQTFNISVSVSDTYYPYTSLLLSASTNSANTSGNTSANTVIDSSYNYNNIIRAGNPGQGTFSPFGTNWSNYFDGSSSYLTTPANTAFQFGTGDFTIECWVYTNSSTTQRIVSASSGGNLPYEFALVNTGSNVYVDFYDGVTDITTGSNYVTQNQWVHLAVTRQGTSLRIFINGVLSGSATNSTSLNGAGILTIGRYSSSALNYFSGYISNLRMIKGTALYTAAFTPTTAPLPVVANTVLLTSQSNRFVDNSTANTGSGFTITPSGNTAVQRFNPFGVNGVPYATSSNTYIGSTYFNGSTDYLSSAGQIANFGTGNFTIDCWFNVNNTSAAYIIYDARSTGVAVSIDLYLETGTGYNLKVYTNNAQLISATSLSISAGIWYHTALVRNSGITTLYVNGTSIASVSDSNSYVQGGNFLVGAGTGIVNLFPGYISNLRIIKGTALYTSNFIPPTAPLSVVTNTSILTCQSSQTVTYDANTTPSSITTGGTPRPTQRVPFSQSYAGQFNGSSAYLTIPYSSAINLATGAPNWTVEFWMYLTSLPSSCSFLLKDYLYGVNFPSYGGFINSGTIVFYAGPNNGSSTQSVISNSTVSPNTWYHLAFVRNSTTLTLYINGVSSNSSTISTAMVDGGGPLYIGADSRPGSYFPGYMSNIRIVKGTAVYTSNFTPANTPLTAIANTTLLTLQSGSTSNTFIDNSTSALTITNNGTPGPNVVSMVAPGYSPMPSIVDTSTATTTYSGSYYLNGSTDYLSIPTLPSLGSNNFTIEGWVYPNANTADSTIFFINAATSAYAAVRLGWSYNSGLCTLYLLTSTSGGSWVGGTSPISNSYVPINSWTHLAVVRNGNNLNLFQNGVLIYTNSSISGSLYAGTLNWIGCYVQNTSYYYFPGYVSNARIITGTALYTTNFTPPTSPLLPTANIAYSAPANTALLLSGTNVGAYDSTMINDFINVGGVSVNSNVKQYGINSYYFNGSNYLQAPTSPNFNFGTGNFTIETWLYLTSTSSNGSIFDNRTSTNSLNPVLYVASGGAVTYWIAGTGNITTSALSTNTWYHVALVRNSGSTKIYLNGAQSGSTYTDSNNFSTGGPVLIGSGYAGVNYFTGYMQDYRVTPGIARYTANFTVPSTPFIAQ